MTPTSYPQISQNDPLIHISVGQNILGVALCRYYKKVFAADEIIKWMDPGINVGRFYRMMC